ncbi:MAG: phosphoenolpyruvate synthase [Bacteroidetes bacterium 4572_128]|nr:MAG: phosphoenolpyruvate synthase [Bacteroidetes bacterium 4572_128]
MFYSKKAKLGQFSFTSFRNLMQKRIHRVLIICSNYDFFMLEEDGRIDERIFKEYADLNLTYPPVFVHANTQEKAFEILKKSKIDLVITMQSLRNIDMFEMAKKIKSFHKRTPIVALTHFSREVTLRLEKEDLSAIDYVFCWLGDAQLLLAIIKLIEDKMNVKNDSAEGVQTILLVEDSIRFASIYLPQIFEIILKQSRDFMVEGLNEYEEKIRMRGRPKILLATNYEEAMHFYKKYKNNMLGIISDSSYMRKKKRDVHAGIRLCKRVKKDNYMISFLLQSSEIKNKKFAEELNVGFLHKHSKTLTRKLRDFINYNFSFGDFSFKESENSKIITSASNLKELQEKIPEISDISLNYHFERHDFSRWLNARALFPLAKKLKPLKLEFFKDLITAKNFVIQLISQFRRDRAKGIIANFNAETYDDYLGFARIGKGSLGGKARGLAFIDSFLKRKHLYYKYKGISISIPKTVVLSTDVFDEFMYENSLYNIATSDLKDDEILAYFTQSRFPNTYYEDLKSFIKVIKNPVAIRSSSVLEDAHYQPFAGIYSTYMIPNIDDEKVTLRMLLTAIKSVYASVFFKTSKSYIQATSNLIDEEKMSIILQEVCGTRYNERFYPNISGVARSVNFYPIAPEKTEDGIVKIAFGLGKIVVEGGITLRFSPKYPKKIIQLYSTKSALRDTQKEFYALDMREKAFKVSTDDGINILKLKIPEAEKDGSIKNISSTYDFHNDIIRDGSIYDGKKIITFSNILKHNTFPMAEIISELLKVGEKEMNNPVEIEFAVNLNTTPKTFSFLQIRPIVSENEEVIDFNLDKIKKENAIIFSEKALGNGVINNIKDFIYVKTENFNYMNNKIVAEQIGNLNDKFVKEDKNYILLGPGRWGSSDSALGIPVKWAQISKARLIVEAGLKNYRIEPSQGTHFFQNLTSFRIGYFTINSFIGEGYFDIDYLNGFKAKFENEFIRHIVFDKPLTIKIDGKNKKGVIMKNE